MAILSVLNVLLRADGAQFSRTFQQGRKDAAEFSRAVAGVNAVMSGIKTAAGGVAAALTVRAMATFVKDTLDGAEASANLAARLDVSTDKLEGLHHAAIVNGSGAEVMDAAIERMTVTLGQAAEGSETAQEAFKDVGVTIADLERLSVDQLFARVADGLSKIEDPAKRALLIREIFGRGAGELGKLLRQGSAGLEEATDKAREYGVVLDAVQAKNVLEANDAVDEMKQSWLGISRVLVAELAPAVKWIAEKLTAAAEKVRGVMTDVRTILNGFGLAPVVDLHVGDAQVGDQSPGGKLRDVVDAAKKKGRAYRPPEAVVARSKQDVELDALRANAQLGKRPAVDQAEQRRDKLLERQAAALEKIERNTREKPRVAK